MLHCSCEFAPSPSCRSCFSQFSLPRPRHRRSNPTTFAEVRQFLDANCARCHGEKAQKGSVNLAAYTDEKSVLKHRKGPISRVTSAKTWAPPNCASCWALGPRSTGTTNNRSFSVVPNGGSRGEVVPVGDNAKRILDSTNQTPLAASRTSPLGRFGVAFN